MNVTRALLSNSKILKRNVEFKEIFKPRWFLESPNYSRMPLWRRFFEGQYTNGSFLFFGNAWTSMFAFAFMLWFSRIFDPPPLERVDKYWLNSPKFRILSAFYNEGKRPGVKISLMTYEARYFYRGIDHPFTINEIKDLWFKLRENYLIESIPAIQYPHVFRQYNNVSTPADLHVHLH
ncbi:hypothetical protein, conserved in Apicomplexan species [Plasmodium ovale wallikeri]|uniref:Uncharacterized protein n=2 Tax=Plasmodium ovale TaxID=36330 RepID=A0A1A8Z051_PLAOA|nr:hypothetical protein, conserved in Apicomplexan species [Plasmodium ovale wallikeri]SBT37841.1 hypothetical protein, conserved in Apicomplexan species [Plasmodium ovale wallikeri]SBT77556.1 conserved Plasmodium protein, unknown function [Plasmodium ovale]